MQIIYVNGRLIKSKLLQTAIDNAYNSYIPVGKFASCVLFLKVHTSDVDVNIHPSKLEVKFNKEKDVFDAIYYALRGALENKIERPTLNISSSGNNVLYDEKKMAKAFGFAPVEKEKVVQTSFFDSPKNDVEDKKENIENKPKENVIKIEKNDFEFDLTDSFKPSQNRDVFSKFNIDFPVIDEKVIEKEEIKPSTDAKLESFNKNVVPYYRIIGEAFETYVFVQVDSKLIVVDKHAAHERINYEKLRMNMSLECPNVQMLLTTIDISFTAEEIDAINNLKNEISKMGFEFDINDRVVSIKAIPIDMEQNDASELFQNLVSIAASNTASFDKERLSMFERALYQASCKASIKGGRHYDEVHIKWIIDNLFRYDCIKYCPHGRPVAFELTNQELDRKFRRE